MNKFKQLLKDNKVTVTQFAKDTKISRASIMACCSNNRDPLLHFKITQFKAIANALNLTLDDLYSYLTT